MRCGAGAPIFGPRARCDGERLRTVDGAIQCPAGEWSLLDSDPSRVLRRKKNSFGRVALAMGGKTHVHGGTQFVMVAAFVILEIVLRVAMAIQSPRDARAPRDEREDLIDMRATRVAF